MATACPFCIQMFEDGIPSLEPDEEKRMRTLDVAELLEVAVGAEATATAAAAPSAAAESPPSAEDEGGAASP